MDRGAWRATVHGVAKSQLQLKQLNMLTFNILMAQQVKNPPGMQETQMGI